MVNPPLTHVLPDGINGSQDVPSGYNPYPYDPTKAKSMLASAGYPNGLSITLLYRDTTIVHVAVAQAAQSDLAKIGVKVKLLQRAHARTSTPSTWRCRASPSAACGTWRSRAGHRTGTATPRWPSSDRSSRGPSSYPPVGSNFGFYNNPSVTALTGQGATSGSASAAATIWAQADQKVMQDAPFYPISPAAAAAVSRQLRAQRRVRAGHSSSSTRLTSG